MSSDMWVKEELQGVDCTPYLQRLILDDPDPSSPLYIPLPPPRSYTTLGEVIKEDKTAVRSKDFRPQPRQEGGVRIIDRRDEKNRFRTSKTQRQRDTGFSRNDPYSMGDPFGGESPWVSSRDLGTDRDPYKSLEDPLYPETSYREQQNQNRNEEYGGDEEDNEPDMAAYGNDDERDEEDGDEGGEEVGQDEREEEGDGEEEDEEIQDEGSYRYSEPMYTPEDEELRQHARNLRERGGDPFEENQDGSNDVTSPVAEGTGTDVVHEGEEAQPERKIKEKFRKDREELERIYKDIQQKREGQVVPGQGPPGQDVGPPRPYPEPAPRIMSGQQLKQQMAMQKLAAAALKAISKSAKGKGRGKRGRVRVMFM